MNIKKTCLNIEYDRYIESIGTLDVLFKVRVKGRRRYPVYCFGYSNNEDVLPLKNKTPFEVAIYECDSSIEYMSFFVEDEKLITGAVGKGKCQSAIYRQDFAQG